MYDVDACVHGFVRSRLGMTTGTPREIRSAASSNLPPGNRTIGPFGERENTHLRLLMTINSSSAHGLVCSTCFVVVVSMGCNIRRFERLIKAYFFMVLARSINNDYLTRKHIRCKIRRMIFTPRPRSCLSGAAPPPADAGISGGALSTTEGEVLRMLAKGSYTQRQIGDLLHLRDIAVNRAMAELLSRKLICAVGVDIYRRRQSILWTATGS